MMIPSMMLRRLYTEGSLKNTDTGAQFALKNRLSDAELVGVGGIAIDGQPLPLEGVRFEVDHRLLSPNQVDGAHPLPFPLRSTVTVQTGVPQLKSGKHKIEIRVESRPFGELRIAVEDAVSTEQPPRRLPRDNQDDFNDGIVSQRRAFIEELSGVRLQHVTHYSFDPHLLAGNCENFVGVAQVPIGFAGPLRVRGEYADGEFLIPMATTDGTMIASYNRGMKVLNACGGVKATVMDDAMQRAPVFVLGDARAAREFDKWVQDHIGDIRAQAEATSAHARLKRIESFTASKFVYLRFNFLTGDAAGQNMVGRATLAASQWIVENAPGVEDYFLESNFATDKKPSSINMLTTRGKRVTAEAIIPPEVLKEHLRVDPWKLLRHGGAGNVGALLSGANNNGLQSSNAVAALFIATGQDAANVAEASAAIVYPEPTPDGGMYVSITIPSLIVATHGGGTGLPTQRECLEVLGCTGPGKVNKLAEIIAGVVLAGEISLAAAISSADWVSSHERLGRNR